MNSQTVEALQGFAALTVLGLLVAFYVMRTYFGGKKP